MRYDIENDNILISAKEFVSTARRGISTAISPDEEEPGMQAVRERILEKATGKTEALNIDFSFSFKNYSFKLKSEARRKDLCKLLFASYTDGDPNKPKKELKAQLRGEGYVTAYAYAIQNNLTRVELTFIYVNSERDTYAASTEYADIKKLERFFNKCLTAVSIYATPEIERVTQRLPSMKNLKFPYRQIRDGQNEFIHRAYKTIARGGTLFATAPTGTGKTISALYPAIRALGNGRGEKIFYFTPKETTANAAVECLLLMENAGAILRAVKISAKEKRCKMGLLCRDGKNLCQNARCNRLPDAVIELYNLKKTVITSDDIDTVSQKWHICPYELSLAYSELCDIIICDFNYLFDPEVYIRRFFSDGGNYVFLIDEAHNLPDRAREMYSAELSNLNLLSPTENELLGEFSATKKEARVSADRFYEVIFPFVKEELRTNENGEKTAFASIKEIPFQLYEIIDTVTDTAEQEILLNYSANDDEKESRIKFLRSYLAKLKRFRRTMQSYDSCYETFIFYENEKITLKLFCIDTGKEIATRLLKGRAAIFFSATLTPLYYYKSLLGGDGTAEVLEVDTPFVKEQLSVSIMDKISTRFSEREDTLSAVCRVIAATVSAKRGNYMIFSPSFKYSELLAKAFIAKYPKIKVLVQNPTMTQKEKEEFLKEFSKKDEGYLIGFCVLGGIYSEGIDLAGDSLIGAVVVGIGMPTLSYEREAIRAYYDEKYEEGTQFAYIYPGMNRVLQAAGRVIRREDDRGVIVLVDDRFDDPIYKKIAPSLWDGMRFIGDAKQLRTNLDEFWSNV